MKRVLISLLLLGALLAVILCMSARVSGAIESILDTLDEAEWAIDTDDVETAADLALDALSAWEDISGTVDLLFSDRDTNDVEDKLAQTYEVAKSGDKNNFKEKNNAAVTALSQLLTAHSLTWGNIF